MFGLWLDPQNVRWSYWPQGFFIEISFSMRPNLFNSESLHLFNLQQFTFLPFFTIFLPRGRKVVGSGRKNGKKKQRE